MKEETIEVADRGPQECVQKHTEETVGVLKQLKDVMTAELDTDGDGKLNLREIFDDMEGPASLRDKFVNAFKEADKDGDGLLETFTELVDKAQGIEFQSSMVLLRKRDPGFVDALDTDTEEQMLDELHADMYADDGHFVCVDTDKVLVRDLARQMWMQDGVTPVIGESETLEHEFRCLGHRSTRRRNQATHGRERRREGREGRDGTEGRSGREGSEERPGKRQGR